MKHHASCVGGWGRPPPVGPQSPPTQTWAPRTQDWARTDRPWAHSGRYDLGHKGAGKGPHRGGPYSSPDRREPRGTPGVWQGIQDVTAAARVALDAARELRSLACPPPAAAPGQGPEAGDDGTTRGWFATARNWLLGDAPGGRQEPPPCLARPLSDRSPPQAGRHPNPDYAVLLSKLLGAEAPERQEPDPQSQDVARLTAELARQQQLLALLVDRVAAKPPDNVPTATRPEAPLVAPVKGQALDPTDEALLEELRLLRAAARSLPDAPREACPQEGEAAAGTLLPLTRPPPQLAAFDPEGDVTQAGAEAFWAWLDVTPRAPWTTKAPYGEWAAKVVYKCTAAELLSWVMRATPHPQEAQAGHQSKRDLLDALARACAAKARAGASSGRSGTAPGRDQPSVLDRLQAARRADS